VTFSENFDEVTPPALPVGWLATNAQGPSPLWVTSDIGLPTPPADTPPNADSLMTRLSCDKRLDRRPSHFLKAAVLSVIPAQLFS
jgi:hypothetical protein